jgi:hypothetical protein
MGWLFQHGASRADIIHRVTRPQENEEARWTTLAHCLKGNVLWAVYEVFRKKTNETERFIGCILIAGGKREAGYKDMCESMHPYFYSCPLAYLDMAPEANAEWRQLVCQHHARLSRTVAIGDVWSLPGCSIPQITITSVRPLRGTFDGTRYRVKRKQLGERLSQAVPSPKSKARQRGALPSSSATTGG